MSDHLQLTLRLNPLRADSSYLYLQNRATSKIDAMPESGDYRNENDGNAQVLVVFRNPRGRKTRSRDLMLAMNLQNPLEEIMEGTKE